MPEDSLLKVRRLFSDSTLRKETDDAEPWLKPAQDQDPNRQLPVSSSGAVSVAIWLAPVALLAVSVFLGLQNLGSPYITLWDESVQANIVRNLADHCCVPELHRSPLVRTLPGDPKVPDSALAAAPIQSFDLGTDYRDWTNNATWLHKPLLPFYLSAAIYRVMGGSQLSLRLTGAIFGWLTAIVLFLIGLRFFNYATGLAGAAIFVLLPYTMQLVHDTEFAGFPDLALAFFLSIALYFLLRWDETRSTGALCWMGFFVGIAWMCKGGLALGPYAVLFVVALLARKASNIVPILLSLAVLILVILPYKLYWSTHFPLQAGYASRMQFSHLLVAVEGHGGSPATYFFFFLPGMLNWALAPLAYFSVCWAALRARESSRGLILALWGLIYLIPLSLVPSKVENFIFPALPAIALLIPDVLERLVRTRRLALLLSLCISSLATWLTFRLTESMSSRPHWHPGAMLSLIVMVTSFALAWAATSRIKFRSDRLAAVVLTATCVALLSIFIVEDITQNRSVPADSSAQAAIRQTGLELRPLVNPNGLILVHSRNVDLTYLYLMYWSGVDTLDLCREPNPSRTADLLSGRNDVYLLTRSSTLGPPLATLPLGNLYPVKNLPPQTWIPIASRSCQGSASGT
jgi:4-amino-4-deoxy-L-arabinose transferase-like glycosyltransferase